MKVRESKRKVRVVWNYQEIHILLDYWAEYFDDLSTMKRNFKNYEEISKKLWRNHNIIKSPEEVSTKILNMRKAFKKERDSNTSTQWPYFERVKAILANEKSNNEALLEINMQASSDETLNSSTNLLTPFKVKPEQESSYSSENFQADNTFTPLEIIGIEENFNEPASIATDRLPSIEHSDILSDTNAKQQFANKVTTSYITINASPFVTSGKKRKKPKNIYSLQTKLLREIKRSNRVSELEMKRANDIAAKSLNVQTEMLDLLKAFQK